MAVLRHSLGWDVLVNKALQLLQRPWAKELFFEVGLRNAKVHGFGLALQCTVMQRRGSSYANGSVIMRTNE